MAKKRKIKGNHVLIIGAGLSAKEYKNDIIKFVKKNNPVTFVCNYIDNIVVPDYHLWNSSKRWNIFADSIDKNSILVFNSKFPKKTIKKKWTGPYKTFQSVERKWKPGADKRCNVFYRNGKMFGCFRDAVILSIFYSYINKASKISVIGMDGYTFYSKGKGNKKHVNAHCFKDGLETDMKMKQIGYKYYRDLDIENGKTLSLLYRYCLKKYGFGFEILTPTVHSRFYNKKVFGI